MENGNALTIAIIALFIILVIVYVVLVTTPKVKDDKSLKPARSVVLAFLGIFGFFVLLIGLWYALGKNKV
jgi:Mn2+/Fe2+ NRAMP family transporter